MANLNPEINIFFLHRIKHLINPAQNQAEWDKGIEVKFGGTSKENFEAARQAYHAYLGAYAYGHDANVDFVDCKITDITGQVIQPFDETWKKDPEPEEEEEPEEGE